MTTVTQGQPATGRPIATMPERADFAPAPMAARRAQFDALARPDVPAAPRLAAGGGFHDLAVAADIASELTDQLINRI